MDGTIMCQGTFVASSAGQANPNPGNAELANAVANVIAIPSGVDWLRVLDYTAAGRAGANALAYFNGVVGADVGIEFYWQRGMAPGTGIVRYKSAATNNLAEDTFVSGGFTLFDPSGQDANALPLLGPAIAVTAVTNATQPVVSTANTAGLVVGSVVRLSNTAQSDVNGQDMVVSAVNPNVSFTLLFANNALANVPGAVGGAGFWRAVNYPALFYPRRRVITNISQAVNAVVSTSIAHGLTPGQAIRFNIPAVSGMIQLNATPANNYQYAIVQTVIDDYDFTININTTAFTAFTYPTIAQQPSSFPVLEPFGEDTATSLASLLAQTPSIGGVQIYNTNTGLLADSTVNTGFLGMILGTGGNGTALAAPIIGPAGTISWSAGNVPTGDVMYWVAGKSSLGGL